MTIELEDDVLKGFDKFQLCHKDRALFFIESDRDFEAQLYAIKGALERNKEAEAKAAENIQHMREQIDLLDPADERNAQHLTDHLTDMFHETVYFDAAHSRAAVGKLAPFMESLLLRCLKRSGRKTSLIWTMTHAEKGFRTSIGIHNL